MDEMIKKAIEALDESPCNEIELTDTESGFKVRVVKKPAVAPDYGYGTKFSSPDYGYGTKFSSPHYDYSTDYCLPGFEHFGDYEYSTLPIGNSWPVKGEQTT